MKRKNSKTTGAPSVAGMALERFAALAEAYGGEIDRWPEAERFAALSLAGRSAEARTLLADAHGLDFMLSRFDTAPDPSPGLRERVASLRAEAGRAIRPEIDMSGFSDPAETSSASMPGAGLFSGVRSNALILSVVVNVVLAGAVGGLWIAPFSDPGPASGTAYVYVEFEEALSEELGNDPAFDGETDGLSPSEWVITEFDEDSSEDFEIASWPEADRPFGDEISAI